MRRNQHLDQLINHEEWRLQLVTSRDQDLAVDKLWDAPSGAVVGAACSPVSLRTPTVPRQVSTQPSPSLSRDDQGILAAAASCRIGSGLTTNQSD